MANVSSRFGIGTLVNHIGEGKNPYHAHIRPIYQTSTFSFPDVATGAAIIEGQQAGYVYSRSRNPNADQLAQKIAYLEALDLLRNDPQAEAEDIVAGKTFASGMAAISTAIVARARAGETILVQKSIYGGTFGFMNNIAPRIGLNVIWVDGSSMDAWQEAFDHHPSVALVFAETPANPTMAIVDLRQVAELAHQHHTWLAVDNTFATPYCQRPLSLGADIVIHSTTKYISGHGVVIGGAVISTHLDYMRQDVSMTASKFGGSPSPFDSWLTNLGLKTFELRMERHCTNAVQIARFLESHPRVEKVYYPGLESHLGHDMAQKQMTAYGGMISFELKDGYQAGKLLMNNVRVATLAVSLGNVDTLIEHPASMTHGHVPPEERRQMGLSDGLVRLSVGIENVEDLIDDLDSALGQI